MGRLTIFAKGNLDVRDTLHSYALGGKVLWNGINEIVRQRFPGTTVRLRHETWTRSDALLEAAGEAPTSLTERGLALGAYPAASQFSQTLFRTDADVVVLSIQPDLATPLLRHKGEGWLFYPNNYERWADDDRQWLRRDFSATQLLGATDSMQNLATIVGRLRERMDAPILVYNVSSVVPGDSVYCHAGLGDLLSTRIRRFNMGLVELSQKTGLSIIDVDSIVARAGADRVKLDPIHLSAEGSRLVAEEVVRVLEDLGCLPPPEHSR